MKRLSLGMALLALLIGCTPKEEVDPFLIYTQAAATVHANLTRVAALTPPTPEPTITNTPEPTDTPAPTPTITLPPTPTWAFNPAGKVEAPILLYSHIADSVDDNAYYQWESNMNVGIKQFTEEMEALHNAGYTAIPMSLLVNAIRDGANLPPRPVVITFDGESIGIYKKAFPLMKSLGFVGNIFMIYSHMDGNGIISTPQLKEMMAAGWEIGSKGYWGNNLTQDYSILSDEISTSRLAMEEKLGVPVIIFAYPYGASDGMVASRVAEWGYKGAMGVFKTTEHSLNTLYYLGRWEVLKDLPLADFMTILPWK